MEDPARAKRFGWTLIIIAALGGAAYWGGFEVLSRAIVPIAVVLVFGLARRFLPARDLSGRLQGYSITDLNERFCGTQWVVSIFMVLVGIVFFWLTHLVLVDTNSAMAESEGAARFILLPEAAIWWFFPGFGALSISWELTFWIWSAFGDNREADLYDAWSSQKAGFDARRVLRLMALFIAVPIGVATILALPMHDALHEGEVRGIGFAWRNRAVYKYSEARRITTIEGFRTRDGGIAHRAGVVIDFADGRRWSSADNGDFMENVNPALLQFLQQKTGLPVQHADTESDIRS